MRAPPAITQPMPLLEVHVLHPGDVVCAQRGARLETLLGSCIAIILTDPRRTLAAMCHFVHACISRGPLDTTHAEMALPAMQTALRARGIVPALCEAYVYGGAHMFPDMFPDRVDTMHVGARNADWAFAALAHEGIPVLAHDVGGCRHRRLGWVVGPQAPQVLLAGH